LWITSENKAVGKLDWKAVKAGFKYLKELKARVHESQRESLHFKEKKKEPGGPFTEKKKRGRKKINQQRKGPRIKMYSSKKKGNRRADATAKKKK